MANLALIRGAGISADRYVSVSNAVDRGVQAFESAQQKREAEAEKLRLEKEREELIKAKDYKSLGALQTDGVPEAWRGWYTQQALSVKDENRQLVGKKGSMNQFDYMDSLSNQNKKIAQMQGSINAIKEYSQAYKDISDGGDFSDSLTADEKGLIQDIVQLNGEPIFKDGQMYFKSNTTGQEVSFDDLPELTTKDYEAHNKIEKDIIGITEQAASKGMFIGGEDTEQSAYLNQKIDNYFRNLEMQPKQALSLATDFLKMGGPFGELAPMFKTLTGKDAIDANNDGDIDENEYIQSFKDVALPEDFVNRVKEQYKSIALNTSSNLKTEYDRVNKIKAQQEAAKNAKTLTMAQQLKEIKERREYADRAILATQDLNKVNFDDINSISTASGGKVVSFEPDEEGNPNPGGKTIIINDKIVIPEDMTEAQKLRKIIEARVQNKMLDQADVPNLLMSLKITGEEMPGALSTPADLLAKYSTQNN